MVYRVMAFACFFMCLNIKATTLYIPEEDVSGYEGYRWLNNSSNFYIRSILENDAKDIFTSESFEQLFTLQMKNFVRDIRLVKFKESDTPKEKVLNKWILLDLDLRRYSEDVPLYFGSIAVQIQPSVYTQKGKNLDFLPQRAYIINTPIANTKSAIKNEVQTTLNYIVQAIARDYYWIADYEEDKPLNK